MKKALKIILSTISVIIILVVAIPIALSMLLQVGVIQNFAVGKVTEILSETTGTKFSISHIDISFFTKLEVKDAYIEDHRGDTLIYVQDLHVDIKGINFITGAISLGSIDINKGQCNLYKDSTGIMNVQKVFDHFKPEKEPENPPNLRLSVSLINLNDFHFTMDEYKSPKQQYGINFVDLDVSDIKFLARNLSIFNFDVKLAIENLSFKEKSGFKLYNLSSYSCSVNENGMRFTDVLYKDSHSALLFNHINLLYDNWYAYNDFVNKVTIDAEFKKSVLDLRSLSYYIGQPANNPTTLKVLGRVRGTIPNLHGYFTKIETRNTSLSTCFSITGLPDINNTKFKLSLDSLTTNAADVNYLYSSFTKRTLGEMSPIIERNGIIKVIGTFEGTLSKFNATAQVNTSLGDLHASLDVVPVRGQKVHFTGHFGSRGFNLGGVLANKDMGNVVLEGDVDAELSGNGSLSLVTKSNVANFYFSGYNYQNIEIDGKIEGKTYEGKIISDDPNCNFTTEGKFDLGEKIPKFDFAMNLNHADFKAIGFNKRDSISTLTARFTAKGTGSGFDNFNGETKIDSITYINHLDTVRTAAIRIVGENADSIKKLKLYSDFADVTFIGTNSYSEILRYVTQAVSRYVPSIPEAEQIVTGTKTRTKQLKPAEYTQGSYTIEVDVKKANNVASIFIPGFDVASGTKLQFQLDPKADRLRLNLDSEYIGTDTEYMRKVSLKGFNRGDSLLFRMAAFSCEAGGIYMPNLSIRGNVRNNLISFRLNFDNPIDGSMAQLRTKTSIYRNPNGLPQIKTEILESHFAFNRKKWDISPSSVTFDSTGVLIQDLKISHDNQYLSANGKIGRYMRDSLQVKLNEFDISPASVLLSELGYRISGTTTGQATGFATLGTMALDARLKFDSVKVNDHLLGNGYLTSDWDHSSRTLNLSIANESGQIPIKGYYNIPKNRYHADIDIPRLDMVLIEPLLQGILTKTSGQAAALLTLDGGKDTPTLAGVVDVKKYDFQVDYTKAVYSLSGKIDVKNSCFTGSGLSLSDGASGTGVVDAYLNTDHFKNIRFGVDVKFNNILALNTTIKDNDVFYGKAYGNGNFKITGTERATIMDINAETALVSEFYLPFTGVSSIEEANFIKYVDKTPDKKDTVLTHKSTFEQKATKTGSSNDLTINIFLSVTKNTKAQISMVSEYMGNQITGVGTGNFKMKIQPSQDIFTMDGAFDIIKGSYGFNFIGFVDKQFAISQGGRVTWTGDPADPEVNIGAVYQLRTSLPQSQTVIPGYAPKVHVDCGITLTGKLFSPVMDFTITAPSADPETQNRLRNLLNTKDAVYNQFFMLFLTGSFMMDSEASSMGSMGTSLAGATGFEFLSNQISNLISNDKISFKFNYRPRTELTSDEFNAGFETDIIPDKLLLEVGGNYSTNNNPAYTQRSPFSADAYLTWVMNKSGTLNMKGFTRVIERFDETQGLQETGLGLYFRQDFQTVAELRQRWRDWVEQSRKNREAREAEREKKKLEKSAASESADSLVMYKETIKETESAHKDTIISDIILPK